MSDKYTTSEKIIAGQSFTVVTLQRVTEARIRLGITRLFCADAIHLEQMARGATVCEHCCKPLFMAVLKKSACYPLPAQGKVDWQKKSTPEAQKIVKRPNGTYNSVRINSSDTVLPHTKHGVASADEVDMLSQTFGYDGDGEGKEPTGFFVGVLRGTKMAKVRDEAPHWVADAAMLREFANTQRDGERAVAVLYMFHMCGQTDSHIADHLGSAEAAITKYRQRLEKAGKARFPAEETKAA
jgi:hypothetical protein